MNDKIKILLPSEIPNLDENANISSIWKELNSYKESFIHKINIDDLGEWKTLILINFRSTNGIGIFKRVRRYPSDKEFEISISICIPNDEQINYGLKEVKESFYSPLNEKNFHILNPSFENYSDLNDYMLESSKSALDLAFTHGFTCNGKRIKFEDE